MFSQIAIIVLGLFLVVIGLQDGNLVTAGLGALVGMFAAHTIYKLKSGT